MVRKYCFYLFVFILSICHGTAQDWTNDCQSTKTVENLKFSFPSEVTIEIREYYIQKTLNSRDGCLQIIEESAFTDSIDIDFLKDRNVMKKYLGWSASGMAYPDRKILFCIVAEKSPIKHELMHMITMLKWGTPDGTLSWVNEGLATYVDKCLEYSNEYLYAYFIQNMKLINTDDLVNNFHLQNEMISYFQAAYLVEYLISTYGVKKLKMLWQTNMSEFEYIYGKTLDSIVDDIDNYLTKKYLDPIGLDWSKLEEGCY